MATKKVDKALEAVQLDINKEYGEGSIMRLGGTATLMLKQSLLDVYH